jgi:alcohol dehydrogenase
MVGVCGTDPKIYAGKIKYTEFPIILGHEIIGWIDEIGDTASARWNVKKGDRVAVESCIRCGYCNKCVSGDYRFCEKQLGYGTFVSSSVSPYLWGGYAEYLYLPPGAVVQRVSDKVPAKAGVLIHAVIADAIRWGRVAGDFCIGDVVVIQGVGQQGLAQTIVAKESGCGPIIVTGLAKDTARFELAKEFGADYILVADQEDVQQRVREITNGHMADVVVDVSGSSQAIITSIDIVKKQGTVVIPGLTGREVATPIQTDRITLNDIRLIGQFTSDIRTLGRAINLVESAKYPIEKIVSHTFSLDEAEKAVRTAGGYFEDVYPIKCVIIP